ncbi:unnamed protein product, partial [Prunus armeniaca]
MACPICKEDVTSSCARKVCYLGRRRWLPWDHGWREKDKEFDGKKEHGLRPREWSGDEILEQLNRLDFAPFGKTKNVLDTLMGTILDIEGKTKDTIKARLDLEKMGIRRGLWMKRDSHKARRDLAFFSMKPNDKKEFLKFVSTVKFPDGYASNIARCVNVDEGRFTGLKSHDCHVFMQRLLPWGFDTYCRMIFLHKYDSCDGSLARRGIACWSSQLPLDASRRAEKKHVDTAFNRPQRKNDGGVRNAKLSVFGQSARPFGEPVRGEAFSKNDMEVNKLKSENSHIYSEELYNLAFGPISTELFSGCNVNGIKFLGTTRDDKLCTQNSGVHVPGGGESTDIDFYGKLTTVVQLLYKDRYQIVYLDDPKAGHGWKVVQQMDQRNVYAIPKLDPSDNDVDVVDQHLESSMKNVAQTLLDSNVIQEPFQLQGVSSREIPIHSITIDLGDLPQYDPTVGPNCNTPTLFKSPGPDPPKIPIVKFENRRPLRLVRIGGFPIVAPPLQSSFSGVKGTPTQHTQQAGPSKGQAVWDY